MHSFIKQLELKLYIFFFEIRAIIIFKYNQKIFFIFFLNTKLIAHNMNALKNNFSLFIRYYRKKMYLCRLLNINYSFSFLALEIIIYLG